MTVKAKFECVEVTQSVSGKRVLLIAVNNSKTPENAEFFKWTPIGKIEMGILNEGAAEVFVPGEQYYVEFTKTI